MRRYWFTAAALAGVLATSFLVVRAAGVTILTDPRPALEDGGVAAAMLGVSLLVADALLPIPASLVMISLGALYGPLAGMTLSLAGRFGMAVAGFELGRKGGPLLARAVPSWERAYAASLVERWGALALIVSRPVPILAETTTILAGASGLRRRVALGAAFAGSIPEAVAYGLVGAAAATIANGALVWLGFLVVAGSFRLVERQLRSASRARPLPSEARSP